jgi:Tfp pilus assembly protein PilF
MRENRTDFPLGWAILMVIVVATVPYFSTLSHGFSYDDQAQVVDNNLIRTVAPSAILARGGVTHGRVEWYRPLTIYTFALNYAAEGLSARSYHLTNLALHAVNSLLVLAIGWRLFRPPIVGCAAALLFAAHAVHTEAVAPVSGRADLLATCFVLLGWFFSLLPSSRVRTSCVVAALLAGLLSKESAIALVALVPLSDVIRDRTRRADRLMSRRDTRGMRLPLYGTLAIATATYLAFRYVVVGGLAGANATVRFIENPLIEARWPVRWATALWVICRYLRLFVVPWPLSADYSFRQIPVISAWDDPRAMAVLLAVALTIAGAVFVWRRTPVVTTVAAIFAVLIAPVSNLVVPIGTIMAERLLYLPSVALCLLFGLGIGSLIAKGRRFQILAGTLLVVAVLGNVIAAVSRNRVWASDERLFASAVRVSPMSAKAHFNYGSLLLDCGHPDVSQTELETALRISPVYPEAHNALGVVHLGNGYLTGAEREFRLALRDSPAYGQAMANLGIALGRQGRAQEAEGALRRSIELDGRFAAAYANLGLLVEQRGRQREAIDLYRRAYELDPRLDAVLRRAQFLEAGETKH